MARQRSTVFATVRTEGGLLPADLLARAAAGDRSVPGTDPDAYHLVRGERLNERITRSWNRLVGAWKVFAPALAAVPDDDPATTLTRERWLLPVFEELGYGRLQPAKALDVAGRTYPISHHWGAVPLHLVGARVDLDHRTPGVRGAAGASPHALVQELLNRTDSHLWAMVANGLRLRLLRDNASLTRQAFVEFDLETMFADEVFDDFVVLWLTCHQSRVEGDDPAQCWLERWTVAAAESGSRARDSLRSGVEQALTALGSGFVAHPANTELRDRLRSGDLSKFDLYRQLLRVVYRLMFLFVAEDRDLLHPGGADVTARQRYSRYYSLARLRTLARRRAGGPHPDQWRCVTIVFDALGRPDGLPALGLPELGSFLWSPAACPDLDRAELANQHLLAAVRHLAFFEDRSERVRRPVDYRNLGTEELGAVYESLLEQHPEVHIDTGRFELNTAAGNERKTTGSYYTPTSLITCLLDSALDSVLDEAVRKPDSEAALLDLKVLDPACGSGHFLIAAGHRIAKRLAAVRTGDDEPSPDAVRAALRDVVSHCLHGIDHNPMAVELCKVSLWMEAMDAGRPLGFLDHRIIRGNALLGTTPELLAGGIPDDAFKPLTGDDKAVVTSLKKRNKQAREGQGNLFAGGVDTISVALVKQATEVAALDETSVRDVEAKARRWSELVDSPEYRAAVHAADTWCAAFVAPKTADDVDVTHESYRHAVDHPGTVDATVREAVDRLADEYGFLHWHLAFLDTYADESRGGFDVVLGNPPWEKVKLSEKEFFAARAPQLAELAGAKRKAAIAKLEAEDPELWDEYRAALRHADGESHLLRSSGRFPLCGRGDVNTYAVFAEAMRDGISPTGRLGVIVPTGIATDDTTKHFFADCVNSARLVSLLSFENESFVFAGVHHAFKFCLLCLTGLDRPSTHAEFFFFARSTKDLDDPERRFTLTSADLELINPNTRTAPVFRTRRDAEVTKKIYRNVPVLVHDGDPNGNPWGIEYQRMFDMSNDSHLFRTADELRAEGATLAGNIWSRSDQRWLPLYEAKMAGFFDHRAADVVVDESRLQRQGQPAALGLQDHESPDRVAAPRYWVAEIEVHNALRGWDHDWLAGLRDLTSPTNERTAIVSTIPRSAVGHTMPIIKAGRCPVVLTAAICSFCADFVARQKLGGLHMTYFVLKQLAVPHPAAIEAKQPWSGGEVSTWLASRILELTYTSSDMSGFAAELGYSGPPFRWDTERRELIRAELDAAFFHLYGLDFDEVAYVMDTFPIVRRKDNARHGEFWTKRLILDCYVALDDAIANRAEYRTILNPPPAPITMSGGHR